MRPRLFLGCAGLVLGAVLPAQDEAASAGPAAGPPPGAGPAQAAAPLPADIDEYQRRLADYTRARRAYDDEAGAYWRSIVEKRHVRNAKRRNHEAPGADDYVLAQPPVYAGPPRPVDPSAPSQQTPTETPYVPVVADFLQAAAEEFDFVPQRPQSESEYKRAYAEAAAAAGLSRDQVVRIYAFECGGNGRYDVQAGLEYARPGARAINTALGYNQLLNTNSVELMAEHGDELIRTLTAKAATLAGEPRTSLERKIRVVRRMVAFSRTVPDAWNEHDRIANTPQGLAVHAMILDVDVGPLLQVQKLVNSVAFARRKGFFGTLSAAELEMMNLTGDGNGLDIVMMPPALRDVVPTANFFQQAGYGRNPVASRNNVVAKLLAATNATMDREGKLPGARELAAAF